MVRAGVTPVELLVTRGLPYSRRARLVDGKDIWPDINDCEARGHVRKKESFSSELLVDLTPFLSRSFDGNDIVVDILMTGNDTRGLPEKGGWFDFILSDVGVTDAKATPVAEGEFKIQSIVTGGAST